MTEGGDAIAFRLECGRRVMRVRKRRLRNSDRCCFSEHFVALSAALELPSHYFDSGEEVHLDGPSLKLLKDSCQHLRPLYRVKVDEAWDPRGLVTINRSKFWAGNEKGSGIVLEIKHKFGGHAEDVDSLLNPLEEVDLREEVSRFHAIQRLKGQCFSDASYNPRDLLSVDQQRVNEALQALVNELPHNKLRLFEEGELAMDSTSWEEICQRRLHAPLNEVISSVALVLTYEPLRVCLEKSQLLGSIGVYGAGMLMWRLQYLVRSKDTAISALWDRLSSRSSAQEGWDAFRKWNGLLFRPGGLGGISEPHLRQRAHNRACQYISNMSQEDCIGLLWGWLVSAACRDCSIMVGLHPSDAREIPSHSTKIQTAGEAGRVGKFLYCVALIDLGPKPPQKILKTLAREAKVWSAAKRLQN